MSSRQVGIESKESIVDGLRIHYVQNFSGRADEEASVTVFLHGWGANSESFREVLSYCADAIAIDLPGFGGSEQPKTAWSLNEYALFLKHFLEKLGIQKIILIGHSFGGSIAVRYAARYERAERLILIGSAGIRHKNTVRKAVLLGFAKSLGWLLKLPVVGIFRQRIRKQLYAWIGSEDYLESGAMQTIYQQIISEDVRDDVQKIKIPVVLIWGNSDKSTPIDDAYVFQKLFPQSRLEIVAQAGHYVFLDAPESFKDVFLKALV
ncbi:MAG: alpha/beta hydrolase [Candidatus Moraniibacteriota bacterium]